VDYASRTSAIDSRHDRGALTGKPVLARLPDVTAEAELQRTAGKTSASVGYRFDPPQSAGASSASPAERRTLKSELIYSPRRQRTHEPHVFSHARAASRNSRRESPILPNSNPFENPRRRLIDSISPVIRFVTLVVLFTAAGIWVQVMGRHTAPPTKPQPPTTTVDERMTPATKTAERPDGTPTAIGPGRTTPEANRHMGHARVDKPYATLRGDILSLPAPETIATSVSGAGESLPRLQVAELPKAGVGDDPARLEIARWNEQAEQQIREARQIPGFFDQIPCR